MSKSKNPIVQEVQDRFETIYDMTTIFTNGDSATKGLLISGDAGTGKTHYVKKAIFDACAEDRCEYIKGSSITAPALYAKLYLNREPGRIVILDDVDIIHKSKGEASTILDLFKGATEMTKGERILGWERASANQLFRDNDIPMSFNIAKKAASHWNAIFSRFNPVTIYLNDQEKLMYTLHLIEEVDMLGEECYALEGGYSKDVIKTTVDYIRKNYKHFNEITPRMAIKIADMITSYPDKWERLVNVQLQNY